MGLRSPGFERNLLCGKTARGQKGGTEAFGKISVAQTSSKGSNSLRDTCGELVEERGRMANEKRKVYLFMSVSLDGFFEGPNHDISWHHVDDEFNRFAIEQLKGTDLFLWGRRIYQLMESYWPKAAEDPATSPDNREVARLMNNTRKLVFSRTLDKVSETKNWRKVKLVREFDPAEIRRLKEEPGKEIGVGGPNLALSLIKSGLVDELRITIVPVAIGTGSPLFQGMEGKLNLELVKTHRFNSGNLLLYYRPAEVR